FIGLSRVYFGQSAAKNSYKIIPSTYLVIFACANGLQALDSLRVETRGSKLEAVLPASPPLKTTTRGVRVLIVK
ncbi:MAG TPA: hypothetical protein VK308_00305, partial [Pyrinomonadaceae bacterium]|nr:hypothetical protein [Pyrinomonadaceae bacterium]